MLQHSTPPNNNPSSPHMHAEKIKIKPKKEVEEKKQANYEQL